MSETGPGNEKREAGGRRWEKAENLPAPKAEKRIFRYSRPAVEKRPLPLEMRVLRVATSSMSGTLEPDQIILLDKETAPEILRPGDVIVFERSDGVWVCHRIVGITAGGEYITRGDASSENDREPVSAEHVIGKVKLAFDGGTAEAVHDGETGLRQAERIQRKIKLRRLAVRFYNMLGRPFEKFRKKRRIMSK